MAHFEISLQTVAYRVEAFGVKLADTLRAMCVGFPMRTFFSMYTQPPHFIIPKIDQVSPDALGPILGKGEDESRCSKPAAMEGWEGASLRSAGRSVSMESHLRKKNLRDPHESRSIGDGCYHDASGRTQ